MKTKELKKIIKKIHSVCSRRYLYKYIRIILFGRERERERERERDDDDDDDGDDDVDIVQYTQPAFR